MVRTICAFLILAFAIAGCNSAGAPVSSAAASTAPMTSAPAAPTAEVTPSPTPTLAPNEATPDPTSEPTPEPTEELVSSADITRQYVRACTSYGWTEAVVIATIKNTGTTWVELLASDSDYTVLDADGNVTTTGSFSYAYPRYLAPGQVGYLADDLTTDSAKAAEFRKVEVDGQYLDADQADAILLQASRIKIATDSFGERTATGLLKNTSSTDVDNAHVAAFFMDAKGNPIGFTWTNLVENVRAGKTKGFETVGDTCQPKWSNVKKIVVLAGDDNW